MSSIHLFYWRKLVQQWCTNVTSFHMQFEKRTYFLGVLQCSPPFSRTDTLPFCLCFQQTTHSPSLRKAFHSNPRPLFFQTACQLTSRRCIIAGPVWDSLLWKVVLSQVGSAVYVLEQRKNCIGIRISVWFVYLGYAC